MHKLILIASDARFIAPVPVDYIIIHSGERYDFILNADQDVGNYWIRAETLEANKQETHMAEAILQYGGAESLNPWNKYVDIQDRPKNCRPGSHCTAVNCPFKNFPWDMFTTCIHLDKLRAFVPQDESEPTRVPQILRKDNPNLLFFNFGFEGQSDTSAINGRNFHLPTTPYQTYCDQYEKDLNNNDGNSAAGVCPPVSTDYQSCIHVRQIEKLGTYEPNLKKYPSANFVLSAVGDIKGRYNDFSHPIHLHGHHFRVIAIRHGKYDRSGKLEANNKDVTCGTKEDGSMDLRCQNPGWTNGIPPFYMWPPRDVSKEAILKDTVIVPAGGYVVIAFEADNPGYWFMHCHIESHQLEGMAVVIQEYPHSQQWLAPKDINRIGNFDWTLANYEEVISQHQICPLTAGGVNRTSVLQH